MGWSSDSGSQGTGFDSRLVQVTFWSLVGNVGVFFSKLFRKESVIIIGGADVISDSRLGYGLLLSGWKRPIVRYAIRNATKVLPTSYYLKDRRGSINLDGLLPFFQEV